MNYSPRSQKAKDFVMPPYLRNRIYAWADKHSGLTLPASYLSICEAVGILSHDDELKSLQDFAITVRDAFGLAILQRCYGDDELRQQIGINKKRLEPLLIKLGVDI